MQSTQQPCGFIAALRAIFLLSFVGLTAMTFSELRPHDRAVMARELLKMDSILAIYPLPKTSALPDFAGFDDVDHRKQAFFDHIAAYVNDENQRIQSQRRLMQPLFELAAEGRLLTPPELAILQELAGAYRLDAAAMSVAVLTSELMLRVDEIPLARGHACRAATTGRRDLDPRSAALLGARQCLCKRAAPDHPLQ